MLSDESYFGPSSDDFFFFLYSSRVSFQIAFNSIQGAKSTALLMGLINQSHDTLAVSKSISSLILGSCFVLRAHRKPISVLHCVKNCLCVLIVYLPLVAPTSTNNTHTQRKIASNTRSGKEASVLRTNSSHSQSAERGWRSFRPSRHACASFKDPRLVIFSSPSQSQSELCWRHKTYSTMEKDQKTDS
jgi:hypothetical protein